MSALPDDSSEVLRTKEHVQELRDLAKRAEECRSPRGPLFGDLCERIAEAAEQALNETRVSAAAYPDVVHQIRRLHVLECYVADIAYQMNDFFEGHLRVVQKARSLYYLCDWLLAQIEVSVDYVVLEGPDIATLSFLDLVYSKNGGRRGVPREAPELWQRLVGLDFHFVVIPPRLASVRASMHWAVVLHELAHVISHKRGVLSPIPNLAPPEYYYDLITVADSEDANPQLAAIARDIMHAMEYVADSLPTLVLGPGFAWCVAVFFARRADTLFTGNTHPVMLYRLALQCQLLDQNGFADDAASLRLRAASDFQVLEQFADKPLPEIAAFIAYLYSELPKQLPGFTDMMQAVVAIVPEPATQEGLLALLRRELPDDENHERVRDYLREEFNMGKPVIVNPAAQYFIAMPPSVAAAAESPRSGPSDDDLNELFADCLKLFHVRDAAELV